MKYRLTVYLARSQGSTSTEYTKRSLKGILSALEQLPYGVESWEIDVRRSKGQPWQAVAQSCCEWAEATDPDPSF